MKVLRLEAPAKLNLFLEVLGRRPDGYHDLLTVMAPTDLCDTIEVREGKRFRLDVEGASLPGVNTVEKAFRAVARRRRIPGARIRLVKRIPAGSGMGGGSSDAATTILALDKLFDLGLDCAEAGAEVGSDVNFFFAGRTAICTGRGEIVAPLARSRRMAAVIVWPGFGLSTAEVYGRMRRMKAYRRHSAFPILKALSGGSLDDVGHALFNRLEAPSFDLRPELATWLRRLDDLPFAGTRMTGSGSALFGLCGSRREATRLARILRHETDAFTSPVTVG